MASMAKTGHYAQVPRPSEDERNGDLSSVESALCFGHCLDVSYFSGAVTAMGKLLPYVCRMQTSRHEVARDVAVINVSQW